MYPNPPLVPYPLFGKHLAHIPTILVCFLEVCQGFTRMPTGDKYLTQPHFHLKQPVRNGSAARAEGALLRPIHSVPPLPFYDFIR